MTQDQVLSIVRAVMQIFGAIIATYAATTGITEQAWTTITGAVLMIVPVIWGVYVHSRANIVAAAARLPDVAQVVVCPTPAGVALKAAAGSTPTAQVVVAKTA